jgi:hypothetical protein
METYSPSPRASETLIIEPASDRYLSPSPAGYDYSTKTTKRTVSRSRSISIAPRARTRRHSSPVRMLIAPRDERSDNPGQLAMVIRPRDSDSSLDDYAIDHYRPPFDPETALYGPSGDEEEVLEIKKDRRGSEPFEVLMRQLLTSLIGPPSRTLRRMLATMT